MLLIHPDYLKTAVTICLRIDGKVKGKVPCNSERGWVGTKPGCKRAKKGTAQRVRGVQRVRQGKSRRPAKATVKPPAARPKRKKPKPAAGGINAPGISQDNVLSVDPRYSAASLDLALDQISTPGAKQRVAKIRSIVEAQGIQAVFVHPRGSQHKNQLNFLSSALGNKSDIHKQLLKAAKLAKTPADKAKAQKALKQYQKNIIGTARGAYGYTHPKWRHVVITAEGSGKYGTFSVTGKRLKIQTDKVFDTARSGILDFSVSQNTRKAEGDFMTYLHELGHQVEWVAGTHRVSNKRKPDLTSSITKYGMTNRREQFAEHFALWALDADRLKKEHPKMHDFIEKSVNHALSAKRRLDSIREDLDSGPDEFINPAQTSLGKRAFELINGQLLAQSKKSIEALYRQAKTVSEKEEVAAALSAFLTQYAAILAESI